MWPSFHSPLPVIREVSAVAHVFDIAQPDSITLRQIDGDSLGEMQIIASGKEEIETLRTRISALEKQLEEMLEKDSKNLKRMTVDKDQTEQLKARVNVLDREVEGAALVREHELVC